MGTLVRVQELRELIVGLKYTQYAHPPTTTSKPILMGRKKLNLKKTVS